MNWHVRSALMLIGVSAAIGWWCASGWLHLVTSVLAGAAVFAGFAPVRNASH